MLSLIKIAQCSKFLIFPRSLAALQSLNISSKLEDNLGLPQKPKRPVSPYVRFLVSSRSQVLQSNPKLSSPEVFQACARKWAHADKKIKKKLTEEYEKDKENYLEQIARYKKELTADQKQMIADAKENSLESKHKRAFRKKLRETNKPKKPASGFVRFLKEAHEKNHDSLPFVEFSKKIAIVWRSLPEEKKKIYSDAYKTEMVRYKQDLTKWELKMIRLGNTDLVRSDAVIPTTTNKSTAAKTSK